MALKQSWQKDGNMTNIIMINVGCILFGIAFWRTVTKMLLFALSVINNKNAEFKLTAEVWAMIVGAALVLVAFVL